MYLWYLGFLQRQSSPLGRRSRIAWAELFRGLPAVDWLVNRLTNISEHQRLEVGWGGGADDSEVPMMIFGSDLEQQALCRGAEGFGEASTPVCSCLAFLG